MEDVWAELGAATDPVDVENVDEAVARSTERVVLVEGPSELLAVLRSPFDLWRIYLHPSQERVTHATFRGPARVTGGPGTGKTVVALHRAKQLAEAGTGRVLLTTFTSTLARSLHAGLLSLMGGQPIGDRIDVATLDKVARQLVVHEHGSAPLLDGVAERQIWHRLIGGLGLDVTETFLAEEWRQVLFGRRVTSIEEYRRVERSGRGKQLQPRQRDLLWPVFEQFSGELRQLGLWTYETITAEATRLASQLNAKPYQHAVIDEAQDVSLLQWRLLRALVAPGPDDLFIAGDTHQRIYAHRTSLREVGINVAGRSARLTLNYRTTAEILAWSLGMLRGERIDDLDAGLESVAGYRSQLHGQQPTLQGYPTRSAELAALVQTVQGWIDQGVRPAEIGVAARSRATADAALAVLTAAGLPAVSLADGGPPEGHVSVGTMHRMKGLEFRCMAVVCLNDHVIPASVTPAEDDVATHTQDLQRERCLLFVACTRAREELAVSWYGTPTRFLARESE